MKICLFFLCLALLPEVIFGVGWTTSIKTGIAPDSISYYLHADGIYIAGSAGVAVGVDSVSNAWTLSQGYRYDAVYKIWWPGMTAPVGGSQRVRITKTAFASSEIMQTATAYWPIVADARLKFYLGSGGDSLVFNGIRNDTTDYDTTLTVPKGHFGRAVVTINYTGTSGLEETWSYDLTDTAGTFLFPPVAGHTCRVWLLVKKPNGTPASGVTIAAMLARSEVRDSAGVAVVNSIIRETTGPDGKASFDLLYSDYMVPQTRWIFVGQSPSVALLRKSVLVPSQDQWYLDFSDTARVR